METTKPSKKKYFDGFVVSAIMGKDGNLKIQNNYSEYYGFRNG